MNSSYNQLHYIMVESSYNHEYECVCVHSPSACCSVTCSVVIAIVRMWYSSLFMGNIASKVQSYWPDNDQNQANTL